MGSKFGFGYLASKVKAIEDDFLRRGMMAAQMEFQQNFEQEKNSETNIPWQETYRSINYGAKILVDTGRLKAAATGFKNVVIMRNKAVLTIDPTDDRGRAYASYHQDGDSKNPKRSYVTQSLSLTKRQKLILDASMDALFK